MTPDAQRPQRLTRAEQQARTRERLLDAAERVFARHGYGGASIDLISSEAGYSKGAIYSNFESKEAVFLELLGVYMQRGMADLERIVGAVPADAASALSQWLETMRVDNDCLLLSTELQLHARRNDTFAGAYYALQARQTRAIADCLKRLFDALAVPMPMDPIDLADSILAITHGVTLQRPPTRPGGHSDAGHIIDELMKNFLQSGKSNTAPKSRRRDKLAPSRT